MVKLHRRTFLKGLLLAASVPALVVHTGTRLTASDVVVLQEEFNTMISDAYLREYNRQVIAAMEETTCYLRRR